ncbi:hypothetical protein KIPB_016124, partial [Kipferlia bialata]|eukprot:g16124.t1
MRVDLVCDSESDGTLLLWLYGLSHCYIPPALLSLGHQAWESAPSARGHAGGVRRGLGGYR